MVVNMNVEVSIVSRSQIRAFILSSPRIRVKTFTVPTEHYAPYYEPENNFIFTSQNPYSPSLFCQLKCCIWLRLIIKNVNLLDMGSHK